jgi:hypothetical protein
MSHIPFHPAPGFGELMPGDFVVPQNPITAASKGVRYIARMGELMPGQFSIPQNPIVKNFQTGMQGMGTKGCAGMGCDGAGFMGSMAGGSLAGMGNLGEIDWEGLKPANWSTTMKWAVGAGVVLMILMYRPDKDSMKADMAKARRDIRAKYARLGRRTARAIGGAYEGVKEAV